MKELLIGSTTLLVGLAIGGLWPLSQVRDLEQQLANAETPECRSRPGADLAGMLHGRPLQPDDPESWEREVGDAPVTEPVDQAPVDVPEGNDEPTPDAAQDTGDPIEESEEGDEGLSPDEQMDAMRTAMEIRRKAARNALIDEAGLDDDQLEQFDGVVDHMNDQLEDVSRTFMDRLDETGMEPSRRDMMVFAADTLDVLLEADDGFGDSMDAEQMQAASEEAVDPLQYIDPALVDLLKELDNQRSE